MTIENSVYRKYRILDAKTGEEKHGKYFVLKIDAKDEKERECVKAAMSMYTMAHMARAPRGAPARGTEGLYKRN